MRNKFDEQLDYLNKEMVEMGNLCEKVISGAIEVTMSDKDGKLAHEVLETDSEIDRKEREIENICMKLLLRQQPVARDLRVISSALKMISDMERIGDQAADIVELSKYVEGSKIKNENPGMRVQAYPRTGVIYFFTAICLPVLRFFR